ncbi:MAG: hypothetical protein U1F20_04280 [Lysobacterales bacterium]
MASAGVASPTGLVACNTASMRRMIEATMSRCISLARISCSLSVPMLLLGTVT